MRMGLLAVAIVAGCLAGAATARAEEGAGGPVARITVTGEGKVTAAPDMAMIQLGVVAENPEAAEAMAEMSRNAAEILARLEAAGIDPADVQTSGLTLSPRWSEPGRDGEAPPRIETFVAASDLTLRVRDIAGLGPLLDSVVQGGANVFRGLQFGLQEEGEAQDAARQAAVAEAARKAALYAEAAGVALGPILSIDEIGSVQPRMMRAEFDVMAAPPVPVAPGTLEISASVTVTYSLDVAE